MPEPGPKGTFGTIAIIVGTLMIGWVFGSWAPTPGE